MKIVFLPSLGTVETLIAMLMVIFINFLLCTNESESHYAYIILLISVKRRQRIKGESGGGDNESKTLE